MIFPFTSLVNEHRELGLIVAVLLGFAFGFVLERAGFGRADKLAAQFYFTDMTVLKVMFSAIVTAMIGVLLASGLGLVDLRPLADGAVSSTYVWSMLVGGLLLGVGFVTSGYCPGTSVVAMASGNLDGVVTFLGVVVGSVLFAEGFPLLGKLYHLGGQGHLYLYDLLGLPPALVALLITFTALGAFFGAEKLETFLARRQGNESAPERSRPLRKARRAAFSLLGAGALVVLATILLPQGSRAAPEKVALALSQPALAHRILEQPWSLRILDLRTEAACRKVRIPGAECVPLASIDKVGLAYAPGVKDLVLVPYEKLAQVPRSALAYPGKVYLLERGFRGWQEYALQKPVLPATGSGTAALEEYTFRAALHSAMTGIKPPPPPPAGTTKFAPRPKKKGGGCS